MGASINEPLSAALDDITPDAAAVSVGVLQAVTELAIEIAREGREGRRVGTLFTVGAEDDVVRRSRCLILDPLAGHPSSSASRPRPEPSRDHQRARAARRRLHRQCRRSRRFGLPVLRGHSAGARPAARARHTSSRRRVDLCCDRRHRSGRVGELGRAPVCRWEPAHRDPSRAVAAPPVHAPHRRCHPAARHGAQSRHRERARTRPGPSGGHDGSDDVGRLTIDDGDCDRAGWR